MIRAGVAVLVALSILVHAPSVVDGAWLFRRQPDLVVTHNGFPPLVAAIDAWAAATGGLVVNGGESATPDIAGRVDPDFPHWGWARMYDRAGVVEHCEIVSRSATVLSVWYHEVGHCLGFAEHFNGHDSIMVDAPVEGATITAFDVAMLQAIYVAKPHVAHVAGVAFD